MELKRLREAAGLSRKDLAAAVGVTPSAVAKWEQGKHPPAAGRLKSISLALQLSQEDTVRLMESFAP